MEGEDKFHGSPLYNELKHGRGSKGDEFKMLYVRIRNAYTFKPSSIFWKEAYEMALKKVKKQFPNDLI